jgi:sarcosine dehydrogenase
VLQAAGVEEDMSNQAFPFMTWQQISVAFAPVRALRVTFVGELGWELHVPSEHALSLYNALWKAGSAGFIIAFRKLLLVGQEFGIVNAGYRCIDSLRLEKGLMQKPFQH